MTERLLPSTLDFDGPFPKLSRRLRLGIVGGGRIAATQAMAARMSNHWDVVAGALSSDPQKAQARATEWFIDPDRAYASFEAMAAAEAAREDGVDAVMITTPNHMHHPAAKAFMAWRGGFSVEEDMEEADDRKLFVSDSFRDAELALSLLLLLLL